MPTDATPVVARRTVPLPLLGAATAALWLAGCVSPPPPEQATAPAPPVATQAFAVAGLEQPAELVIDRWGVPHSYAAATYDAFVAQGFAAARDRLWQMDLWRKRGLGEMARDFGPAWVESDRMARAVLFRGDMYREWLAYGSDAKRVAEAFVAGVNAWVAQVNAKPESLLPMEFKLLGYRPVPWSAEDVVRIRHHGLTLQSQRRDRPRAGAVPAAERRARRLAAPRARSAGAAEARRRLRSLRGARCRIESCVCCSPPRPPRSARRTSARPRPRGCRCRRPRWPTPTRWPATAATTG